jgi:hypothetical protein
MAPADQAGGVPALMPLAAVGALLLFSAADLALSKRLFDARPSCWPVIGTAAAFTVWAHPVWGLLGGCLADPDSGPAATPGERSPLRLSRSVDLPVRS